MHKILLVEESKDVFEPVKLALGASIKLDWVRSVAAARDYIANNEVSLVLMGVELPDGNGIELCNELHSQYPMLAIFFLTDHSELPEKIMGFSAGAEDYITKPFELLELKARVEAKLKRLEFISEIRANMEWGEIEVVRNRQEVFIKKGGTKQKIELTALEFKILSYFCDHTGSVISRDKMLDEIWGKKVHIYPRSVDTHVSKLRRKLVSVSHIIKSVHGVGYKFEPTKI